MHFCFSFYFCHCFSSFPEFFSSQSSFSFSVFFFCLSCFPHCTFSLSSEPCWIEAETYTTPILDKQFYEMIFFIHTSVNLWNTLIRWNKAGLSVHNYSIGTLPCYSCAFVSQLALCVLTFEIKLVWFLRWLLLPTYDADRCKVHEENSSLLNGWKAPLPPFWCPALEVRVQTAHKACGSSSSFIIPLRSADTEAGVMGRRNMAAIVKCVSG